MPDQTIKCPKCGAEIPLTEALTGQIEGAVRAKYEAEAAKQAAELEKEKKALAEQQKELQKQRESIDSQVDDKLKAERKKIAEQEKAKVLAEQAEQTKAYEEELAEKAKKIGEMQKQEIELRRQQRELAEKQQEMELENQRKLDAERKQIEEKAAKKASEESMLKMREKDDQLDAMKEQIGELKRKAEVGSQERQGEALEGTLQDTLQQAFAFDRFEKVEKGQRGADILQIVRNKSGKECGTILWESKNTKDFQKGWIEKIKADQQEASADLAVIMSMALPKEIRSFFGQYEDVWITDYQSAVGLCSAFRQQLILVERERLVGQHQEGMKDVVYQYVTGQEFAMRVKRIADAYIAMQADLESEKRSMQRIWSKREKQISTVLDNLSGMRGEIEGLVGGQNLLPAVDSLSLEGIIEDDDQ